VPVLSSSASFQCEVAGCGQWLGSILEQEIHYNTSHQHSCSICGAQLVSFHILQLHLEEQHDSLFQLRATRQDMYHCFLEPCKELFANAAARHQHCVTKHCFPADFCYSPQPSTHISSQTDTSSQPKYQPSQLAKPTASTTTEPAARLVLSDVSEGAGTGRRFAYRVPEAGVRFGSAAVPSFRRYTELDDGEIDMASLAAALEEQDSL